MAGKRVKYFELIVVDGVNSKVPRGVKPAFLSGQLIVTKKQGKGFRMFSFWLTSKKALNIEKDGRTQEQWDALFKPCIVTGD